MTTYIIDLINGAGSITVKPNDEVIFKNSAKGLRTANFDDTPFQSGDYTIPVAHGVEIDEYAINVSGIYTYTVTGVGKPPLLMSNGSIIIRPGASVRKPKPSGPQKKAAKTPAKKDRARKHGKTAGKKKSKKG
jgi:hypothetical protein